MLTSNIEQYNLWLRVCKSGNKDIVEEEKSKSFKTFASTGDSGAKMRISFIEGGLTKGRSKTLWLYAQVAYSFKKYWENNEPILNIPTNLKTTDINRHLVDSFKIRDKFYALDINHCYWRMAFNEGYILESLYNKGLERCNKVDLVASLGCLSRDKTIRTFKGETLIKSDLEDNKNTIGLLYKNIVYKTNSIIKGAKDMISKDFVKYNVDCIFFTNKRNINKLTKYFNSHNLDVKLLECFYLGNGAFLQKGSKSELKRF